VIRVSPATDIAAAHTVRLWANTCARTAVPAAYTQPAATMEATYSAAPARSRSTVRVAAHSARPRTVKTPTTTTRAAAVGASRPTRPARSSSDRPDSSSLRVARAVRAIAMTGMPKATMNEYSFIITPPRVSSPATRPVSMIIDSPTEAPYVASSCGVS
jgi:hypothetical protein